MPGNTAFIVKLDWAFWVLLAVLIVGLILWKFVGSEGLSRVLQGSLQDSLRR